MNENEISQSPKHIDMEEMQNLNATIDDKKSKN